MRQERRGIHSRVVVCKLRSVRELLCVGTRDSLIESRSHGNMIGEVGCKPPVKVRRPSLKVSGESSILRRKIIVFLFVHFLIDNVLLGDSERSTCSALVDLGSSSRRFNTSFQTSVAPPRSSNICTGWNEN